MKRLYQILFYLSLVLLFSTFVLPPMHGGIPIERRLLREDQWELKFTSPDHLLYGADASLSKEKLVKFLRFYNHIYGYGIPWLSAAFAVAMAFSVLGWRREICLEKQVVKSSLPAA